jgi:mRNA-degrading endonuclease toxin of MazEF toxin-antitoxin module
MVGEPACSRGKKSALLLSRNDAYRYLSKAMVAEITTTIRAISVEVRMGRRAGLTSSCVGWDEMIDANRFATACRGGPAAIRA